MADYVLDGVDSFLQWAVHCDLFAHQSRQFLNVLLVPGQIELKNVLQTIEKV